MRVSVKLQHLLWGLAALVFTAFFVMLGLWQLGRARDKEALVAAVEDAGRSGARHLSAAVVLGPERPVRVSARGRFELEREVLLDNQPHAGRAGVTVLTPFRLTGQKSMPAPMLLIDRGWLPIDLATRRPGAVSAPPRGDIVIRGLLTALPGVGVRMGDAAIDTSATRPLLAYLDQAALHAAFGPSLVKGLLRLDPDLPGGFLRDYQPVPAAMPPARHRGYAVQWFALGTTVFVTWLLLAFRRK